MKFVKKCISLPEEVHKFAKQKADKVTRERGSTISVSGYIAELIAQDKKREESQKPQLAHAA